MNKIGSQRVPFEGPESDYKIMVVGESPGKNEVAQGRPFVGKAGELLERYLNRAGVRREEIRLANLCKYRPEYDKFRFLLKSPQLTEGIEELREEINRTRPNVVIGCGNWPLWFLTGNCGTQRRGKRDVKIPGSGIMDFRGSRLPMKEEFGGGKFFSTFHPSFVRNYVWSWNPVFYQDIIYAVQDAEYPELRYPEYDEWIDPDHGTVEELVKEALNARWNSVDIETFRNHTFSCVGFSWQLDGRDRAFTITYKRPDLWIYAQRLWEAQTPKIFQYGTYDISFMSMFYQWKIGGYYDGVGWDTYVASASIFPDYPRSLSFLTSWYTRFPYYKEDRKVWKEEGDMNILWRYNIKDCVGTHQVALGQMKDIKELYG